MVTIIKEETSHWMQIPNLLPQVPGPAILAPEVARHQEFRAIFAVHFDSTTV